MSGRRHSSPQRGSGPGVLTPQLAARIALLGGVAFTLVGILLVRLWFLQVVGQERYTERAESNRLRTVLDPAQRGAIVDRGGRVIVANRTGRDVAVRPRDLEGARGARVLRRLAPVLDMEPEALLARVRADDRPPYEALVLAEDVDRRVELYLSERARQFPGVELRTSYPRALRGAQTLAHVMGYTGAITAETIKDYRRRGYVGDERVGTSGLEYQYEDYLAGTPGEVRVEVDAMGEPVDAPVVFGRAAEPGSTLELSVHLPTQRALEAALREEVEASDTAAGGAGVALIPRTGEVLAIASYPTYRPAAFTSDTGGEEVRQLLQDPRRPLLNRAIAGLYPAGSTFKVATATAALEEGLVGPRDHLSSPGELTLYGQTFRGFESRSWGSVDLRRALEVSSDTYFYQLGDLFYQDEDGTPLQTWARRMGFGATTGIDVPGEVDGLVPDPAWKRQAFRDSPDPLDQTWKPGDSINLSTGQGNLLVTPLQMATAYAAIANGGTVVTPRLARRVLDPAGGTLRALVAEGESRRVGFGAETLAALRDGLYAAANNPDGTATAVFGNLPEQVRVAGKTGTAENETANDHSWYVGYAPYDDPRIVVAVVIEQGGQGGNAAAPAVCRTMAAYLRYAPSLCGAGARPN